MWECVLVSKCNDLPEVLVLFLFLIAVLLYVPYRSESHVGEVLLNKRIPLSARRRAQETVLQEEGRETFLELGSMETNKKKQTPMAGRKCKKVNRDIWFRFVREIVAEWEKER